MGKKKNSEKILELQYTVEALVEEVKELEELVSLKQSRIVELIGENDRLTLTYEPFNPEGSECYGLDFYGLKEDNDVLTEKVGNFIGIIREQDQELYELRRSLVEFEAVKPKKSLRDRLFKESRYAGDIAFDYWPISDWFRLSVSKYRPGQYFQLCIGPIRIEFFAA